MRSASEGLLALALLASCADEDGSCEQPDGIYELHYVARSRDCALKSFTAVVGHGSFSEDSDIVCTGPESTSEDGCTEESARSCVDGDGSRWTTKGVAHVSHSGRSYSGTFEVQYFFADGDTCRSIYDVTAEKL